MWQTALPGTWRVVQVLRITASPFLSKVQYRFLLVRHYKEHSSESQSPLRFPLPFHHGPTGGRQACAPRHGKEPTA